MLATNITVGLLSTAWTALLGLAVIPIYLRHLGMEAYGLIGFFATMHAVLQLLDLGIAPTINREVARHSAEGHISGASDLLHTLAVIYWCVAAAMAVGITATSHLIAEHWLQSKSLPSQSIQEAVVLLGIVIACRWPNGIYLGTLMGAQRIDLSSAITALSSTLGSIGAVIVLTFVSPSIQAFFTWQIVASLAGTMLMRQAAWHVLRLDGEHVRASFNLGQFKGIWKFSAGMSAVALLGLVFTQMDKLLLSKMLLLSDYGVYTLATTVSSVLYIFVTPLFNAVYPRFSVLVAQGNTTELAAKYRTSTQLLAAAIFPVAAFLALFSNELVTAWTGDAAIATAVSPLIQFLAVGSALHGVMYMPYALQLAHGQARLPLVINSMLLCVFVPLLAMLTIRMGALGAALAWLVLHCLYLLVGTWLTHRSLLVHLRFQWISSDVAIPFAITACISIGASLAARQLTDRPVFRLCVGLTGLIAAAALCIISSAHLRNAALGLLKRVGRRFLPNMSPHP